MFTIEGRREQLDEFACLGEEKVLPALRRLYGFESLLVLANHRNGKVQVVTLWESEERCAVVKRSRTGSAPSAPKIAGGEVTNVERYEVVYSETGEFSISWGSGCLLFGRKIAAIMA